MPTPNRRDHPMPQAKQTYKARFRACERGPVRCRDEGLRQLLRGQVVRPAAEAAQRDGGEEDYGYERWCLGGGFCGGGRGREGGEGEDPEGDAGGDLGGGVSAFLGRIVCGVLTRLMSIWIRLQRPSTATPMSARGANASSPSSWSSCSCSVNSLSLSSPPIEAVLVPEVAFTRRAHILPVCLIPHGVKNVLPSSATALSAFATVRRFHENPAD